jgi:hypothetical protein
VDADSGRADGFLPEVREALPSQNLEVHQRAISIVACKGDVNATQTLGQNAGEGFRDSELLGWANSEDSDPPSKAVER